MPVNVTLSESIVERLKAHAEPLIDTFETVIGRALDALDGAGGKPPSNSPIRKVNPASPPNLAYTTVHSIVLDGKRFAAADTYWNTLLIKLIKIGAKNFKPETLKNLIIVNSHLGQKENNGYKFIEEAGVSVQGQDANNAWKGIYHLLKALKIPADIEFSWQENPKATFPGERAQFEVRW
jgi:hypothetical protein